MIPDRIRRLNRIREPKERCQSNERVRELGQRQHKNNEAIIYISGPFHADTAWGRELQIRSAEIRSMELWQYGFPVICTHAERRFLHGAVSDEVFFKGNVEKMKASTAISVLLGWQNSEETIRELEIAHELMIPKFFTLDNLLSWFGVRKRDQ